MPKISDTTLKGNIEVIGSECKNPDVKLPRVAYSYWIHCNFCYHLYYTKTLRLYLLPCDHILCEKCITLNKSQTLKRTRTIDPTYICKICSKIGCARLIGNHMPHNLKQLFHPKPWLDNLPNGLIYNFQRYHRNNIQTQMRKLGKRCNSQKRELVEAVNIVNELKAKLLQLKQENAALNTLVVPMLKSHREQKLTESTTSSKKTRENAFKVGRQDLNSIGETSNSSKQFSFDNGSFTNSSTNIKNTKFQDTSFFL